MQRVMRLRDSAHPRLLWYLHNHRSVVSLGTENINTRAQEYVFAELQYKQDLVLKVQHYIERSACEGISYQ